MPSKHTPDKVNRLRYEVGRSIVFGSAGVGPTETFYEDDAKRWTILLVRAARAAEEERVLCGSPRDRRPAE